MRVTLSFMLTFIVTTPLVNANECRCGRSPVSMRRQGRVIGGRESDIGAFPWIAGIVDHYGFNFCGGALINSRYILTAAHCVHNKRAEDLVVIVGQTDLDIGYLMKRGVYRVTRIIPHPRFIPSNWSHDIALLRILPLHPSPTTHSPEPICLPARSERSFADLLVAGWGKTSDSLTGIKPSSQSQTNTAIRGTRGYVAPEWFRSMPITVKVDVYSFGILLLEIICCRRSVDIEIGGEEKVILADWAYECYRERTIDALVENDEESLGDFKRLERFVMLAIWCIQEDPSLRPTMKKVMLMLEGIIQVPIPPCPFPFSTITTV